MGIEALPTSTVRAIGATQVLNDPGAVVKELIDNALDARSTSISIEIHSNTLDSIQVRDNGHGIPPEDRLLVARPHCTSKISDEDDLRAIGGTSLGFRGEALASAAEMSGSLTICTRVEGEEVATALKVNQQGEIVKQDRASLPVGTTVKITDFIKAHPVRRQVALKNAEKTLVKIKQTLKAYAFARPHVRLSLRVLKAKNDKGNWTYAPNPGGNAEDAAFKLVGMACASQCTWSVIEDRGYTLQAFLPKPDAEVSKYSNIGPFVSVDARPVSTARGTGKQIVKIFREGLKKANPEADGVKESFLFLDISCPPAAYDANVEPAKDDVLFEDPDKLIGIVRELFDAAYPRLQNLGSLDGGTRPEPSTSPKPPCRVDDDEFTTSLELTASSSSRCPPPAPWTPLPSDGLPSIADEQTRSVDRDSLARPSGRVFRLSMYGCDEEDLDFMDERPLSGRTEADFEELRQARYDAQVSNPWILAKLNTTVRRQVVTDEDDDNGEASSSAAKLRQKQGEQAFGSGIAGRGLPTPGPSSPMKPSAISGQSGSASAPQFAEDGRLIQSQPLLPPGPTISLESTPGLAHPDELPVSPRYQVPAYNYNPHAHDRASTSGTPLHMIPNATARRGQSPKKRVRQTPFKPPLKSPVREEPPREKVWFDHLENIDQRRPPKRPYQPREITGLVTQGELGDLVDNPRSLTPPRRNRDMRDFLTPREDDLHQSVTDMVEARNYSLPKGARSATSANEPLRNVDSENHVPSGGVLGGRGFIPASELLMSDDRFGPLKPDGSRVSKRRKTSEKRAFREISGNAAQQGEELDKGFRDHSDRRAASSRRQTTNGGPGKSRRRKSSLLPLERVPQGKGTHDLALTISKRIRDIASVGGKMDEERSLLRWDETAVDAHGVFATPFQPVVMEDITAKLRVLLSCHLSEGDVIQDLGQVVSGALAAHLQAGCEVNVYL